MDIRHFFEENSQSTGSFLLGLSGGPDSLALLYLLLEAGISPHIAHVDHGMREESGQEADKLKHLALELNLPFHLHRIEAISPSDNNLEEKYRKARYQFFLTLHKEHDFEGVVLGHHQGDQSETMLKRVFETRSLFSLRGIEPISEFHSLKIFRPLLSYTKEQILSYCDKKGLNPFLDPTNNSSSNLRGKMRKTLLPDLEKNFGKTIRGNLAQLALESRDLREYMEERIAPLFQRLEEGSYDLRDVHPFELKLFLRKIAPGLAAATYELIIEHIQKDSVNKQVGPAVVDRGKLKISLNTLSSF